MGFYVRIRRDRPLGLSKVSLSVGPHKPMRTALCLLGEPARVALCSFVKPRKVANNERGVHDGSCIYLPANLDKRTSLVVYSKPVGDLMEHPWDFCVNCEFINREGVWGDWVRPFFFLVRVDPEWIKMLQFRCGYASNESLVDVKMVHLVVLRIVLVCLFRAPRLF